MSLLVTDAVVLHAFDYRETSRIVRFATRDAGTLSAIARGARRPRARLASGLDLFARGVVQVRQTAGRDLHTLVAFDAERPRLALAASLDRFAAAAMLAELALRAGGDAEPGGGFFEALDHALDRVAAADATADAAAVAEAALAGAWRLVAASGHEPTLETCAHCHEPLPAAADLRFHHRAGGALCDRCATRATPGMRALPAAARAALRAWLLGDEAMVPEPAHRRAHQRLLREFVEEHLGADRPLRAFAAWERRVRGTR